jgi:hypothetical protein
MKNRAYKFFAHFNRINMQRGDPKVWTVHYQGTCHQTEEIEFYVPVKTRYRARVAPASCSFIWRSEYNCDRNKREENPITLGGV